MVEHNTFRMARGVLGGCSFIGIGLYLLLSGALEPGGTVRGIPNPWAAYILMACGAALVYLYAFGNERA